MKLLTRTQIIEVSGSGVRRGIVSSSILLGAGTALSYQKIYEASDSKSTAILLTTSLSAVLALPVVYGVFILELDSLFRR